MEKRATIDSAFGSLAQKVEHVSAEAKDTLMLPYHWADVCPLLVSEACLNHTDDEGCLLPQNAIRFPASW